MFKLTKKAREKDYKLIVKKAELQEKQDRKNEKTFGKRFRKIIKENVRWSSSRGNYRFSEFVDILMEDFTGSVKQYETLEKEAKKLRKQGFEVEVFQWYEDRDPQYARVTIDWSEREKK